MMMAARQLCVCNLKGRPELNGLIFTEVMSEPCQMGPPCGVNAKAGDRIQGTISHKALLGTTQFTGTHLISLPATNLAPLDAESHPLRFMPGDHILKKYGITHTHHAIYESPAPDRGSGWHYVIHYVKTPTDLRRTIERQAVQLDGYEGFVIPEAPQKCLERARSRIGKGLRSDEGDYDLLTRNCEHFAFWCTERVGDGKAHSVQSDLAGKMALGFGACALAGCSGPAILAGGAIAWFGTQIIGYN
jgi:hypothetical protein